MDRFSYLYKCVPLILDARLLLTTFVLYTKYFTSIHSLSFNTASHFLRHSRQSSLPGALKVLKKTCMRFSMAVFSSKSHVLFYFLTKMRMKLLHRYPRDAVRNSLNPLSLSWVGGGDEGRREDVNISLPRINCGTVPHPTVASAQVQGTHSFAF